jgi:hypothetical protein
MAGNTGSPLCAELNRIANYGVYPDRDDFLEEQGAANVWAGTTGQGLLGALNYIVDPNRTDNNYKGLTAVCNELAGTTGLSDVDALRTINHPAEVLLKGTTARSASYYVDAATPRYNYPGYIRLDGTSGNYLSTPDATALDITGDIDLRVRVALDDWTPAAANILASKAGATGQISWFFFVNTTGVLRLDTSPDGTATSSGSSSVATGFTDGASYWVRVTRIAATGVIDFYTAADQASVPTSWTALGTATSNTAGNIFNSTAAVEIGTRNVGATQPATGKFYRAQVLSGIGGTTVLDVDLTTNVTSATYNQFTATTGQLVTINGQDTLTNGGTAGSLLPTTVGSSTAADSNDPKFLDHTGTNYVYLPGVGANILTVPDSTALRVTGDIDIRANIALDSYLSGANQVILSKWDSVTTKSYGLYLVSTGALGFYYSGDGTTTLNAVSNVLLNTVVANGQQIWTRVTFSTSTGNIIFYTSTNGTTWTQLGSTIGGTATTLSANASRIEIGSIYNGSVLAGKIFRAQVLSGINGTTVLDVDTSVITTGAATSFTAVTGQTVTINRATSGRKTVAVTQPTWLFGTDDYMEVNNRYMAHSTSDENYVYLSGAFTNYMSIPDNPPLDITGDLDIRVKVALDDWTPAATQTLIAKYNTTGNQRTYRLDVPSPGILTFVWSADGVSANTANSTVATGLADGAVKWVRATLDVDNGASGRDVKFFLSDDGVTWTQLGSTVTSAGVTSIYSSNTPQEIGAYNTGGASPAKGKFFRAQVLNGIDGTIVLDADASVITLPSQTTFVDRSSNAYTVTINKSGVGTFVSTGNYLYLPGISANYASTPDAAALDITGDLDLRVKVALDDWTPSATTSLIAKWEADATRSWHLRLTTSGTLQFRWYNAAGAVSGTILSTVATGVADGATKWVRVTFDVDNGASGNDVKFFLSDDGLTWTQLGATVTTAGTTDIRNGSAALWVGADDTGAINPARGKFFRAQVLNGIGGTVAFDANFENSITSLLQTSFTESSTNGATVTINRSGSTFRSAGVIDAGYLYPGATNTFSNSTTDFLNFGATNPMTIITIIRPWSTQNAFRYYITKSSSYGFGNDGTNLSTRLVVGDAQVTASSLLTNGGLATLTGVVNRATSTATYYVNNSLIQSSAFSSAMSTVEPLRIARTVDGFYQDFEFIGAAVFRTVLTAKNIADITNYFNGRD